MHALLIRGACKAIRPVDEYVDEEDQLLSGDHIVVLLLVKDTFD